MIDPDKLAAQRRVFAPPTDSTPSRGGIKAPSCLCGSCRLCQRREWMRRWRAGQPKANKLLGPHFTLGRLCKCGEPISDKNRSGMCQACWKVGSKWRRPKPPRLPRATPQTIRAARARLASRGIMSEAA